MPQPRPSHHSSRWAVVFVGFLTLAFAFTVRGSLSLAMPEWQREFGWSRGAISSIAATALLVMAATAPFAGHLVDRHGAQKLLVCGLGTIGFGMVMVVLARPGSSSWLLPIGFAGVAAVGFGIIAQHVVSAAVAQRFEDNRGFATGVGTSGSTAGQLILMPVIALVMQSGHWRNAFFWLAVGCFLLIPFSWMLLRAPKSQGLSPAQPTQLNVDHSAHSLQADVVLILRSAIFHADFWSYAICGFTTSGVIETHLMPYAALCGFGPVPSATAYGVLCGINLVGMDASGWLSDRVHRPRLLAAIYSMRAIAFLLLVFIGNNYPLLIVFSVFFGLFDYSTVPVTASYVASRLGLRTVGLSMGLLSAGHAIGGAAGAWAGGAIFDGRGNYSFVWGVSIALVLVAIALTIGLPDKSRLFSLRVLSQRMV